MLFGKNGPKTKCSRLIVLIVFHEFKYVPFVIIKGEILLKTWQCSSCFSLSFVVQPNRSLGRWRYFIVCVHP